MTDTGPISFDFVDWDVLAASSAKHECFDYSIFAREWLGRELSPERKLALDFLSDLFILQFPWARDGGQALMPDHVYASLRRDMLTALVAQLPRISDNEIRARIVDAAWMKERACTHNAVPLGVDAYLEEAKRRFNPEHWPECFGRLQRAVVLAATLGGTRKLLARVFAEVEGTVQRLNGNDPLYLTARLMELLLEYRQGDATSYAALAHQVAESAAANGEHDRAITYLEIAGRWHQRGQNRNGVETARGRIIEVLETTAKGVEPILACHLLTQAIEASRRVPNGRAKSDELRVRLQEVQREAVADFARYETTIDLTACIAETRNLVGGKPVGEAVLALCSMRRPAPIEEVRERVAALAKESVFLSFIPHVKVSATGRVLARNNGLMNDEEALRAKMHHDVAFHQQIFALGAIRPAVKLLQLEHGLRMEDFLYIAGRSPFVPHGRESTFARGLTFGFWGDFSLAAYLLFPQVENAIRLLIEGAGGVTTTLTSNGLQNEKDINQLLVDPGAMALFGEPLLFDLRSLLTEKSGANLRNEMAHGLLPDGTADDHFAYFWWITLRLVLTPFVTRAPEETPQDTGAQSEPPQTAENEAGVGG